jgi:hypothetical protein
MDRRRGSRASVSLRLKVENERITEAEWVVNRKGDRGLGGAGGAQADAAFYDPEYLAPHAPPERTVARAERLSRSELVAITNSYFDAPSARAPAGRSRLQRQYRYGPRSRCR